MFLKKLTACLVLGLLTAGGLSLATPAAFSMAPAPAAWVCGWHCPRKLGPLEGFRQCPGTCDRTDVHATHHCSSGLHTWTD